MWITVHIIDGMDYRDQMITLIETLARHRGLSESRISCLCSGGGNLIRRLREKRPLTVDRYLSIKSWFGAHWPPDLPWPAGVDRPDRLPEKPLETTEERP